MPSRLQQTIAEYRARLLAQERTAMASLDYAHRQTLALIEPRLDALYDAMSKAQANGEDISKSWLYEQNRLETLTNYLSATIDHFGALTQMQVQRLQYESAHLGQQSGMALLNSVVPPGVNFSFGVPSQSAIASLVGATQKGSPLSDLFSGFGAEAAQLAKTALISGVTLGYGPRQIAPGIQDALNVSRNRALTIARTEALRSYRDSSLATYQANSDVVSQYRWTCDLSSRTCAMCLAMDGQLFDLDQEMDTHPNCRCSMVPQTKSWDEILGSAGIDSSGIDETNPVDDMQTGSDWFDNQSEAVQRQVLGPAKFAAYQDGALTLQDLVGTSHSDDWGTSRYEKSLKDAIGAKKAKQYYA